MGKNFVVQDIMTQNVTTVCSGTTFLELMKIFQTTQFHFLPVLSPEGKLLGLINKADYYQMLYSFDIYDTTDNIPYLAKQMKEISVERIMRSEMIVVEKNLPFSTAVSYLRADIKNALLVLEQDRLIGIVTIHDIFNTMYGQLSEHH